MNANESIILIIDNDDDLREFVSYNLKKEGFNVITAASGIEGVQMAREKRPHLILLDMMIPGMNGLETCYRLRQEPILSNSMIAFFTVHNDENTIILGLEAGADDYITKPLKPRVLISKVNSLLRRVHTDHNPVSNSFKVGDLIVDTERFKAYLAGRSIILPKKEFELLSLLVSKPNKVFTRSEIFNQIWHDDLYVDDKTINVHVRKIREKLGTDNIKTIKKVGYKYEYEV